LEINNDNEISILRYELKIIRFFNLFLSLFFFFSCSTYSVKYSARLADKKGNTKDFSMIKGQEIEKSSKNLCYFTAILYGGYCWTFLGLPTEKVKAEMRAEATVLIQAKYPDYSLVGDLFERINFNKDKLLVNYDAQEMIPVDPQKESDIDRLKSESDEKQRIKDIKKFTNKNVTYKKFEKLAIDRSIAIGMPGELVLYALGQPEKINRTVGKFGTHAQFVYANGAYIYLENGILTSWQVSE